MPNLEIHRPRATAKMPIAMLAIVYTEKLKSSLFFRKLCFSKAKAENVVNPPQKPVARNKVLLGDNRLFFEDTPRMMPIRKHPAMLTKKVPKKKF